MRVTLKVNCWEAVFDFESLTEGYNFAKSAQDHYNRDAGDKAIVKITMSLIPDKDETEN